MTLRVIRRVGQRLALRTVKAVGSVRSVVVRGVGRLSGYPVLVGQGRAVLRRPTAASLFSREGGSPVWVPAFAGKHVLLADWDGCLPGLNGPCHAVRARGDMPHPDPPLKGREFSSCHHAISARHATHSPRGRGTLSSGLMITLRHGAQLKEWIHAKALRREEKTGQVR